MTAKRKLLLRKAATIARPLAIFLSSFFSAAFLLAPFFLLTLFVSAHAQQLPSARPKLVLQTGHIGPVVFVAYSPDGHLLVSGSTDGSTRVWDPETGEHLATVVSFEKGPDWMVVTPEGLFDGSTAAWNQLLRRFGGNTFDTAPVEVFFNEFYYPGLLSLQSWLLPFSFLWQLPVF